MSDSRDSFRRLKQLSGRVSLFEFFMAIFLLALYIMKPEILSPLTEHLSDSSFLPVMTALLLFFPFLWAGLTVLSHREEMSDDYDDEEDAAYEEEEGDEESSPEHTGDSFVPAPFQEDAFGNLSFLRVQKLSDRASISARDRVLFLRAPGRFKILTDTAVPDSAVIIEYKDRKVTILAARTIELRPGVPLVLFSRSTAGTRIPQYALTYVMRREADHA